MNIKDFLLTVDKITDIPTQELLHGVFILLEAYPQAKVRMGYDRGEIHIRGVDDNLPQQDKKLLESYGWQLVYYEDEYFWEFELRGYFRDE